MNEVFPMEPAAGKAFWILGVIALSMVVILFLFAVIMWSARNGRFELVDDGLRVRADIYSRTVPYADLDVEGARRLDLAAEPEWRLKWRSNGVGLPGYLSGWFKLRNGDKALAFVTDTRKLVLIPTEAGYQILLTPRDPDRFLQALRQRAGRTNRG